MTHTHVAIQAALRAGEILRKGFGTKYDVFTKEGRQNLVTEYDHAAEKAIISLIREYFPNDAILAEESGAHASTSTDLWVIDPLDGTLNYAHHIPVFCVSIGVAHNGIIRSGVIYQPMTNELFVAEKGFGAFLNGVRLSVSKTALLQDSVITTGFPNNVHENPMGCVDTFADMVKMGVAIRRFGSAAIDLAYVAAGRFDAYWDWQLQPWDVAAGKLLVEEAGGMITHFNGAPLDIFADDKALIVSNGHLHEQMIAKLKGIRLKSKNHLKRAL